MKLLEISIVARSRFGLVISCNIVLSLFPFLDFIESISGGDNEKKAVSEPDTKPEKNNKTIIMSSATTVSVENPRKNCPKMIFNQERKASVLTTSKMNYYLKTLPGKITKKNNTLKPTC